MVCVEDGWWLGSGDGKLLHYLFFIQATTTTVYGLNKNNCILTIVAYK